MKCDQVDWSVTQFPNSSVFFDDNLSGVVASFNVSSARVANIDDTLQALILDYETCNTTVYNDYFFMEMNSSSIEVLDDNFSKVEMNIGFYAKNITNSSLWIEAGKTTSELLFCLRTDLTTNQTFYRGRNLQDLFSPELVNDSVAYTKTRYNITVDMSSDFSTAGIKKISQKELDEMNSVDEVIDEQLRMGTESLNSCQCDEATRLCYLEPPPIPPGGWLTHCIFLDDGLKVSIGRLRKYTLKQMGLNYDYVGSQGGINELVRIMPIKGPTTNGVMISLRMISAFFMGFSDFIDVGGGSVMQYGVKPPKDFGPGRPNNLDNNGWGPQGKNINDPNANGWGKLKEQTIEIAYNNDTYIMSDNGDNGNNGNAYGHDKDPNGNAYGQTNDTMLQQLVGNRHTRLLQTGDDFSLQVRLEMEEELTPESSQSESSLRIASLIVVTLALTATLLW